MTTQNGKGRGPSGSAVADEAKTSRLAIASLVLGVIGLVPCVGAVTAILALIFGIVALTKIGKDPAHMGGKGLALAGAIVGGGAIAWNLFCVPIVAAIAIPNLLESRVMANESNAVASLKVYCTAQSMYKKANYASANGLQAQQYAPSFAVLGGPGAHKNSSGAPLSLVSDVFARATGPTSGYQGYYFVDIKVNDGKPLNPLYEYALCAVPCQYDRTGIHTYVIDHRGTVQMKDNQGQPVTDLGEVDATWGMP